MFFKVTVKKDSGDKVAISGDKIKESNEILIIDSDRTQLGHAENKLLTFVNQVQAFLLNKKVTGLKETRATGMYTMCDIL